MDVKQLKDRIASSAFAFRGYDIKNLGRSAELLEHPVFGPIVEQQLHEASEICGEITGHRPDLIGRVRRREETTLESYTDAITLIVGMELVQLKLLKQFFDVDYHGAKVAYGYSLGEIPALVASGVFHLRDALRIPLALANDCVELAANVYLGILFSRGPELPVDDVRRLCLRINNEGRGIIGISAFLSPNSLLLLGQGDTVDRFKDRMVDVLPKDIHLRKNKSHWPPMHTPIVWEKFIPNRCDLLIHTLEGGFVSPKPPILSLVTGKISYNDFNARDILCRWTDHPQRLWDAVYETLAMGIDTVVHVGPNPNIIPATFTRLSDNVKAQTKASFGKRALSAVANRSWLKAVLPARTALFRAPLVEHVLLEDWLLEQPLP